MKTIFKVVPLAAVLFVAGCASTSQVEEANAKAAQAQQTADQALAAAARAQSTADQALSAARAAQASADQANEKVDRAFKRAMEK